MSKFIYLIDAGHGGIDKDGNYTTCPNWKKEDPKSWYKMFVHDGEPIFEGETNRAIADKLAKLLDKDKIKYSFVHDPVKDTPLQKRVEIADKAYAKNENVVFISIHSNAGGGQGIEIYTSPGQTKSDQMAELIYGMFDNADKWRMRKDYSDGDNDKEAPFYVLRKTDCPAILVELLFFDNPKEAKELKSEEGQNELAERLKKGIDMIEKYC